jgi:hypothetical protein
VDEWPTLGPLESVAVLKLSVVLREGYNTNILQFWYQSLDIHFILLHVKFKDTSFISVSKNRAARYKWKLKILSKDQMSSLAHLISNPAFSKFSCKKRVKSCRRSQVNFIDWMRLLFKLYMEGGEACEGVYRAWKTNLVAHGQENEGGKSWSAATKESMVNPMFLVTPCVQSPIWLHVHPVLMPESLYRLPSHSII